MKFITRITKERFLEKEKRKTRVKDASKRDFCPECASRATHSVEKLLGGRPGPK
jgi:hypothetical protein